MVELVQKDEIKMSECRFKIGVNFQNLLSTEDGDRRRNLKLKISRVSMGRFEKYKVFYQFRSAIIKSIDLDGKYPHGAQILLNDSKLRPLLMFVCKANERNRALSL